MGRTIKISKLILNIAVGEKGERMARAYKVLEKLTGQRPKKGHAHKKAKKFNKRLNMKDEISCYVTVRGEKANELLEAGLKVKEFNLISKNFANDGSFGFGILEHIDLGIKYDSAIGIYGMDFYVVMERPGYRVARRRRLKSCVGVQHRVTKEEAIKFESKYEGVILAK